jgi:hypothetical protein
MLIYEGEGDGFGGNNEFHIHYSNDGKINSWMTGGINIASSSGLVSTTKFNQVVFTVKDLDSTANANLYLNTVNVGTGSGTIVRTGYGNTLIGRPSSLAFPTPPRSYEGNISIVNVYNKVLSLDEINNNYNSLRGRFGL